MIQSFIESWDLFANTYAAGWLIAILLGMIGVIVIARDQIFIGAATAQASTFGVALALVFGGAVADWLDRDHAPHRIHAAEHGTLEHALPTIAAMVFAVAAALLTMRIPRRGRDSQEAMTGWVFLMCWAGAILVVAHSPHGLEEVKALLASMLISPPPVDIGLLAAATLITAAAIGVGHRRMTLIVMDSQTAAAMGLRVWGWNLAMAVWLGLVLGLALHVAGLLYVFGCLVLPPLLARNLCRTVAPLFIVAPILGLILSAAGFILAHHWDLPLAHVAIALMAAALPLTWAVRKLRQG